MWRLARRTWAVMRRPSVHFSLGFLTLGGFLMGVVFWGGFNTALEATNTEAEGLSCGLHRIERLMRQNGSLPRSAVGRSRPGLPTGNAPRIPP